MQKRISEKDLIEIRAISSLVTKNNPNDPLIISLCRLVDALTNEVEAIRKEVPAHLLQPMEYIL